MKLTEIFAENSIFMNLRNGLMNKALVSDESDKILAAFASDPLNKVQERVRLNDDVQKYSWETVQNLRSDLDKYAAKWIAKHMPNHWARPLFGGEAETPHPAATRKSSLLGSRLRSAPSVL